MSRFVTTAVLYGLEQTPDPVFYSHPAADKVRKHEKSCYVLCSETKTTSSYLWQHRTVDTEADQPGRDKPMVLHIHRIYIEEAAAGLPRLHLQLQLLHCGRRQNKHTSRLHLYGEKERTVKGWLSLAAGRKRCCWLVRLWERVIESSVEGKK